MVGEKGKRMTQAVQGKGKNPIQGDVDVPEVTVWAEGLAALHAWIARHLVRSEPRRRALAYRRDKGCGFIKIWLILYLEAR